MPFLLAASNPLPEIWTPFSVTSPVVGRYKPEMTLINEDLPEPLGPINASTSPYFKDNETPSTALTPPKYKRISLASNIVESVCERTGNTPSKGVGITGRGGGKRNQRTN